MFAAAVILLVSSSAFGGVLPGPSPALAADGDGSPSNVTVYDFQNLDFEGKSTTAPWNTRPSQPGWALVGEVPSKAPVVSFQSGYGVNIGTTQVGQFRSFTFDAPETGIYRISFKARNYSMGGIGELSIDDRVIGTRDFYSPVNAHLVGSVRTLELTEGSHTFTLRVIGKNAAAPETYRMTASELILEKLDAPPVLSGVQLAIDNPDLYVGSVAQLSVDGTEPDGTATDIIGSPVVYGSADAGVAAVDPATGQVTAVGQGETTLSVSVSTYGQTLTAQLPVQVKMTEPSVLPPIVHEFQNIDFPGKETTPWSTRPSQPAGWSMAGAPTDVPVMALQSSYGVDIGTTRIGQFRTYSFDVPEAGIYLIRFKARTYSMGGIGELLIDDRAIGTYDFYSPANAYVTKPIRTMELAQGPHTLTLRVVGKNAAAPETYRMTASEFVLQMVAAPPALSEVQLSIDNAQLYPGSKAQLFVDGTDTSGVASDMIGAQLTFASVDTGVAAVDAATGKLTAVGQGETIVSVSVAAYGQTLTAELPVQVVPVTNAKTRSTIYTPAKVQAARDNIAQYDWAERTKNAAVAKADQFVALGLNFLWDSVAPQSLPRSYAVNEQMGSPLSGKAIDSFGAYPYKYDPIQEPWKIVDPTDGHKYPTNDFGAYYRSGLDEHGVFDRSRADGSLLYNTEHPDPNDPLHKWGVDDGLGWVDDQGNRYTFIAYYVHWALWGGNGTGLYRDALKSLGDAYLYTGEAKYARAGGVLLDRIADIYPSLDISAYTPSTYINSHGGTRVGKSVGSIWETFVIKDFLYAYDALFAGLDDPQLIDFLTAKSEQYELGPLKYSAAGIRKNIEDGIVKQVFPGVKNAQIRGNNGFHQRALALAAVVYDTLPETQQWIDFNFQSGGLVSNPYRVTGGNMGATFVNDIDRDGHGNEAAPGYNRLWLDFYLETADILSGYDLYPAADLYANPKFRKMFHALYPLTLSERYTPQIGDTGYTGNPSVYLTKGQMIKAFQHYGDPIFAQIVYFLNNGSVAGIHGDIFDAEPEQVAANIQQVIAQSGPLDLKSVNLTGYGFTALRDGHNEIGGTDGKFGTLRDLWMYYGRTDWHGHRDTLNIGLHAFGLDVAPDLGYPEYAVSTDTHRTEWVNNTVSHNTVVVDRSKQQAQIVAQPRHFDDAGQVKLIDVEAPDVYPQTDLYKRTTAMIRVDDANSYAVDFFRVKGGDDHVYSFHGGEGPVTVEGLNLVPQADGSGDYVGSYAGSDVPFGIRPANDSVAGSNYMGSGFHYLVNVDRDNAPGSQFSVDWQVADTWNVLEQPADVHLRLTMMGDLDDVAIADGIPPRNKPGNPESLSYVLAHRSGTDLDSLFTSVIEPYKGERYIQSIAPLGVTAGGQIVTDGSVQAVRVMLTNGRTDIVISALDPNVVYTVDGRIQFSGAFGVYSERNGQPVYAYTNEGSELGTTGQPMIAGETARVSGTVESFTDTLSVENELTVQMNLGNVDPSRLVGMTIFVDNDGQRNAAYLVRGVETLGTNRYKLDIGDTTLIRSYVDANDFSQGFVYDVAPGAGFVIPLSSTRADTAAPTVQVMVNGAALTAGQTFVDTDTLAFTATVQDDWSSVVETSMTVDGVAYTPGTVLDMTGSPGEHQIVVTATDAAGNTTTAAVEFIVTATSQSLAQLLHAFKASGDLSLQAFIQLDVHLKLAVQFAAANPVLRAQALQQMEQFVVKVDQAAARGWASSAAGAVLKANAAELVRFWA